MNQGRAQRKADKLLAELPAASESYAALAEQLTQESWHLPPSGDQSWREMDALRIFGNLERSKPRDAAKPEDTAKAKSVAEAAEAWDETARQGWGGILAILALVPAVTLLVAVLAFPDMLTTSFWRASPAPLQVANGSVPLRASLADGATRPPASASVSKGVLVIDATPKAEDVTPQAPADAVDSAAMNTSQAAEPVPTPRPDLRAARSGGAVAQPAAWAKHPMARRATKLPAVPRLGPRGRDTDGFYAMVAGSDGTLRYQYFPSRPTR
jgi:hypothetical protein